MPAFGLPVVPLPPEIVSFTASITLGVAEAELFERFGSNSKPLISAVFVYVPVALTLATTVKVAVAPFARVPIDQVGLFHEPVDGVALIRVYPEGNISVTVTPVPSLIPLLLAVIVKVTLVPAVAFDGATVFVIAKSA